MLTLARLEGRGGPSSSEGHADVVVVVVVVEKTLL